MREARPHAGLRLRLRRQYPGAFPQPAPAAPSSPCFFRAASALLLGVVRRDGARQAHRREGHHGHAEQQKAPVEQRVRWALDAAVWPGGEAQVEQRREQVVDGHREDAEEACVISILA